MAKKKKSKSSSPSKSKLSKFTLFDKLILLISFTGFITGAYLTYIKYSTASSFCNLSENVSCDVVTTSIYSDIFGIPLSLMAVGYFGLVFALTFFKRSTSISRFIFFLTVFVLFPSYYLTGIEIFELQAYCILCEFSKLLMISILVLSYKQTKYKLKEAGRLAVPIILAGLVAAAVTFFAQSSGGTKEDYTPFVESLNNKGVVMYKSFKCSNCKRQEKLFGKAYSKLNQVECHPEGSNAQAELCLQKGINKTPTLLLEKDGGEVKRLEGLQKLEKIAEWAEVPLESEK